MLDIRATLLLFLEDVDVKRICTSPKLVEIWLGHSVTVTRDIATPKELTMAEWLKQVQRDEVTAWEDGKAQLFRPLSEQLSGISSFSVAPPLQVKHLSSIF